MTSPQNPRGVMRAASWRALIAVIALLASAVAVRMTSAVETRSASVQWVDVLIVQIVSSLPLAWWIGVWSGNEKAIRLYGHYGFRPVGEYKFPVGDWLDDEFILRRERV